MASNPGRNPFAGAPQIGGLYNANLQAELQKKNIEQSNITSRRRMFSDAISTGLIMANRSRIADRNREAQLEINQRNQESQMERLEKGKELELQNKLNFMQQENLQNQGIYDNYMKFSQDLLGKEIDPDRGLQSMFQKLRAGVIANLDPRFVEEMSMFGAADEEEAKLMAAGLIPPDFDNPALDSLKEYFNLNRRSKIADVEKKEGDVKLTEVKVREAVQVEDFKNQIEKDLLDVKRNSTLTQGEKDFIVQANKDRRDNLQTAEGMKTLNQAKVDMDGRDFSNMANIIKDMSEMRKMLLEVHSSGGSVGYSDEFKAGLRALVLRGDSEEIMNFMTTLKEEDLITRGNLDRKRYVELTTNIFVKQAQIKSKGVLVGRSLLEQKGNQSDVDVRYNIMSMIDFGASTETQIAHLQEGKNNFLSGVAIRGAIAGSNKSLDYALRQLHDDGYVLNRDGLVERWVSEKDQLQAGLEGALSDQKRQQFMDRLTREGGITDQGSHFGVRR
jgi:hypothetical protein